MPYMWSCAGVRMTDQLRSNELIHEVHTLSYSDYSDHRIASKINLPTPNGIPLELWLSENGLVIGLHYYREKEPHDK